ncbi:hypothetical protein P4B35_09205 [Pontiellaceae bacterium B12227]|nr:hypothetical protein [Pontiellaceae bacterium B12227]
MKKLLLTALCTSAIVAGSMAQTFVDVTVWEDTAPSGGNMQLTTVPDPSGLGYGDVGAWDSTKNTGQYENYNSGNLDLSDYAGLDYTLSCEIYLTAAQAADANVTDDTFYSNVGGQAAVWRTISGHYTAGWNTYERTGTFTPNPGDLTAVNCLILINDKGTQPTTVTTNLYVDNYKMVIHDVEVVEPDPTDVLWDDRAPSDGGMSLNNMADPFATGHGTVGEYISGDVGQWANYNPGNHDWSAYAGQKWTLSVDVYITAAQFADSSITDNQLYISVGAAGSTGWKNIGTTLAADAWTTVTWTGMFDADPNALTNVNALILNNHQATHPISGPDYYFDNFKLEVDAPQRDTLWEEPNPAFNTVVTNAFGDGIGEYDSSGGGQWDNYGVYNNDWTDYVGLDWKFSFEIYLTSNQLADAAIADDNFFYSVAGDNGGYMTISEVEFVADSWNTVQWFGAFSDSAYDLTNVFARISNNDQLSHPATAPNFYTRNFKFEAEHIDTGTETYVFKTNVVDFLAAEGFVSGGVNGQVDWVEGNTNADIIVDAVLGTATSTDTNVNMTLLDPIGELQVGDTVSIAVDFSFDGLTSQDAGTNNNYNGYFLNMGLTIQDTGEHIGAENPLAEALRFQRFYSKDTSNTFVRLLPDTWSPATGNIADIADGDELQMIYSFTLGTDAASSFVEATLTNITQGTGIEGTSYGVTATNLLYDALVSTNGGGAYVYVESVSTNYISDVVVDKVTYIYPELYVVYESPYAQWEADNNVVGGADDDDDNDGLSNYGEYVFGGNPGVADTSILPEFDAATGNYTFSVRADDTLTYVVIKTDNLVHGPWVTNTAPVAIIENDAQMDSYTEAVGTTDDKQFIKLIVE